MSEFDEITKKDAAANFFNFETNNSLVSFKSVRNNGKLLNIPDYQYNLDHSRVEHWTLQPDIQISSTPHVTGEYVDFKLIRVKNHVIVGAQLQLTTTYTGPSSNIQLLSMSYSI